MRLGRLCGLAVLAIAVATGAVADEGGFVAGTTPDRRPEGAPVITTVGRGPGWVDHATRGITPPIPLSVLLALCEQGNWYTPFTRPGMPGVYDIRGLHALEAGRRTRPAATIGTAR